MTTNQHPSIGLEVCVASSGRPQGVIRTGRPDRIPAGLRCRTYLWQLWPGRNWPCTAEEERIFVRELAHAAGDTEPDGFFERSDITAMMNALRCGLTYTELIDRAPGLQPRRLLAGYQHLHDQLQHCLEAWAAICHDPAVDVVRWHLPAARQLLKSVTVRFDDHSRRQTISVPAQIRQHQQRIDTTTALARDIEHRLAAIAPPDPVGIELGRILYDPYDPGLWCQQDFLPERVGTLSPPRIANLLEPDPV